METALLLKVKKNAVVLPPSILLSITAILFAYGSAIVSISPVLIIRSILVGIAIVSALYILICLFIKSRETISLLLFIITGGLFLVESMFYAAMLSCTLAALGLFVGRKILRIKADPIHTNSLLMSMSILILLATTLQFAAPFSQVNWPEYWNAKRNTQGSIPKNSDSISNKPDIYYIILDAYARNDVLVEYYNYDNTEFIRSLNDKGFAVPTNATSNYPYTTLSLASSLNMDYIDSIASGIEDSHLWWLMESYIDESRTHLFLEEQGYEIFHVASDWSITDNPDSNNYLSPYKYRINEFESYFISTTPFRIFYPLLGNLSKTTGYDAHRDLIIQSFNILGNIPETPNPKFVFAHIIAPHPPFVFTKNGEPIKPDYNFSFTDGNDYPGDDIEYRTRYVEQLQYTNILVEKMVDEILQRSKIPPIIILQADHGPRMLSGTGTTENVCIKERFSIFAAYHLPGKSPSMIPANLSPVNAFRIIFNEYFQTELPMLQNKILMPTDKISIFKTENVDSIYMNKCHIN